MGPRHIGEPARFPAAVASISRLPEPTYDACRAVAQAPIPARSPAIIVVLGHAHARVPPCGQGGGVDAGGAGATLTTAHAASATPARALTRASRTCPPESH